MPMDPSVYAEMLGEKLDKYGTKVYLVNTGWAGGSAAAGAKRMKLAYTRAMVTAALNGSFDSIAFKHHDVFNVDYPVSCPGVPDEMLDARGMWAVSYTHLDVYKRQGSGDPFRHPCRAQEGLRG